MTSVALATSSRVAAAPDQVSCDLAGEAAILHLKSGVYYGLNATGARVWGLLHTPTTVAQLRDTLLSEYAVDPARLERDLLRLLSELVGEHLIDVGDDVAR
jgi:hypothetical protein